MPWLRSARAISRWVKAITAEAERLRREGHRAVPSSCAGSVRSVCWPSTRSSAVRAPNRDAPTPSPVYPAAYATLPPCVVLKKTAKRLQRVDRPAPPVCESQSFELWEGREKPLSQEPVRGVALVKSRVHALAMEDGIPPAVENPVVGGHPVSRQTGCRRRSTRTGFATRSPPAAPRSTARSSARSRRPGPRSAGSRG